VSGAQGVGTAPGPLFVASFGAVDYDAAVLDHELVVLSSYGLSYALALLGCGGHAASSFPFVLWIVRRW